MADSLPDDLEDETPEQVRARIGSTGGLPDDLEGSPAPQPIASPTGPVLRPPVRSTWNTIRDVVEATGVVPRGLIPDEGTARGAVASVLQGPAMQWADEAAGVVRASDLRYLRDPKEKAAVNAAIDGRLRSYVAGGMAPDAAKERATKDVLGLGGTRYREGRDTFRNVEGAFRAENPAAAFALTAGAGALSNPISIEGKGTPLVGAGLRYLMSPSEAVKYLPAAVQGAINGAGAAEEADGMGEAAAVGAPLGVAGQAVGEIVGDVIGEGVRQVGQSRLFTGVVQPSTAAQYLRSKHVGGLTIGQMAPDSKLAQLEEASTSAAGIGPAIKAQRDVARQQWQQAVLREALPPGQTEAVGDGLGEQVASVFGGFGPAYDEAAGHAIDPRSVQAALQSVDDPSIYASDATRQQVGNFIKDQLTAIRLRSDGAVDSGEVMALRSFLRQELRNLPDDARQERTLFQTAVDTLSNALDTELPSDAATALRAADMQYAKAKTVADAVGRSRDQVDGFTTKQLSTAVAQNTPTPVYQKGGGGELRALARAGEQVLSPKIPMTGARLLAAGPVPYVTGPLAYAMNLPGPKAALLGQTGLQQSVARGAAGFGEALGPAMGELGAASAYAQRSEAEASVPRSDTSTSDIVSRLASTNPEALGPYAQRIQQAAADGNLPLVHYTLQQKDPQYRAMLDRARAGETE